MTDTGTPTRTGVGAVAMQAIAEMLDELPEKRAELEALLAKVEKALETDQELLEAGTRAGERVESIAAQAVAEAQTAAKAAAAARSAASDTEAKAKAAAEEISAERQRAASTIETTAARVRREALAEIQRNITQLQAEAANALQQIDRSGALVGERVDEILAAGRAEREKLEKLADEVRAKVRKAAVAGAGPSGVSSGAIAVYDDGSLVARRQGIEFVGPEVTDDPDNNRVTVDLSGTYQPLAARLTTLSGRTDATEAAALRTAALDAVYVQVVTGLTTGGVVENTTVIQAALDAASAAGGGTVIIPIGLFLTDTVNVPSNVTLAGLGWGSKLLMKPKLGGGAGQAFSVVQFLGTSGSHISNAHVRDLYIDGNKANHTAPAYTDQECVQIKYADYCSVTRCRIVNAVSDGIDSDYGVDCLYADNVISACGGSGVHVSDGSSGCITERNVCFSNGATFSRAGISDYSNAADCVFLGNVAHDNYRNYEIIGFRQRFSPSNLSYGTVTAADVFFGMGDVQHLLMAGAPQVQLVRSGDWYPRNPGSTSAAHAAGVMTFYPVLIPKPLAYSTIACRVTGAIASSAVRLGIYSAGPDGYPQTLRHEFGTVPSTATGDQELNGTWNLRAGLHWFAALFEGGAPTMRAASGLQAVNVGTSSRDEALNVTTAAAPCIRQTGVATGALPATAAAAASLGRGLGAAFITGLVA